MPDRFISVVAGIEQFYDLRTLPFEEAIERHQNRQQRTAAAHSGGVGITAEEVWRGSLGDREIAGWSWSWSRPGERPWPWRERGCTRRVDKGKGHIQCFNCKNYGHYANWCLEEKKGDEAHHAKAKDVEPLLVDFNTHR